VVLVRHVQEELGHVCQLTPVRSNDLQQWNGLRHLSIDESATASHSSLPALLLGAKFLPISFGRNEEKLGEPLHLAVSDRQGEKGRKNEE